MKRILTAAGLAAVMAAGPAAAHHSAAMFDMTKTVTITGVVKEFQWTNPHTWIQVVVTGPAGKATEWSIESQSTGTLSRQGWRPKTFKPGDKVSVRLNPMKDGTSAGFFVGAILADGKSLGRMEP
jgi:hypothetical protein